MPKILKRIISEFKPTIEEYRQGLRFTKKNQCVILNMLILLRKNLTKLTKGNVHYRK